MTMEDHANHQHKPHVLPLSIYIAVGTTLFVLTGITVAVAKYIHLGGTGNMIVAMIIATIKGSLVALFFMHLFYDNKLYAFAFCVSLFMLAAFIVFTMFDTLHRDDIYDYRSHPLKVDAIIYDSLKLKANESPMDTSTLNESLPDSH